MCHYIIFMSYWNFEYTTQDVTLYHGKVGGSGMGQGTAFDVTHLRLNQPPVFPVLWYQNCELVISIGILTSQSWILKHIQMKGMLR